MFNGSMVALITPMQMDGSIDMSALADLVDWHLAAKTDALVINGTTGECVTLDAKEQYDILSFVVQRVAKRIPVIAGTGTNSTQATLTLSQNAKQAGADACLVVTPYYNKPPQNGLYEHYKTIAERVQLPIIIYNVPKRTACDVLPETVARLAKLPNIVGIKEATGEVARTQAILSQCENDFEVYSGDDPTALALMQHGAKGVISVTANVVPDKMHQLCKAALSGNQTLANQLNQELALLHERLFVESNPIPTKWALQKMKKIKPGIRLPLLPLDEKFHQQVHEALKLAGVETS